MTAKLKNLCLAFSVFALSGVCNSLVAEEIEISSFALYPAKDFAEIKISEDSLDSRRKQVLMIRHERSRTSKIIFDTSVVPFSAYLFTLQVRKGKDYVKTGTGFFFRVFAEDKEVANIRYMEEELSQEWQTLKLPVVSGVSGKIRIMILLGDTAGEVFLDNVKLERCSREELVKTLGSGYDGSIPQIPLKDQMAEARVHYNEIFVSQRIASIVSFQMRSSLPKDIWENSAILKVELPAEIEMIESEKIMGIPLHGGYLQYRFDKKQIHKFGRDEWWCSLLLTQTAKLRKAPKARFWLEWEGGRQKPVEVEILQIDIPVCAQPQQILCGTQNAGLMTTFYGERYPEIIKSLGFNYMTYWKSGKGGSQVPLFQKNGIKVETEHSGLCEYMNVIQDTEEAKAVNTHGEKVNVINPAHRGILFKTLLQDMDRLAGSGFLGIAVDDEYYSDWRGTDIDMSEETKRLWKQWLAVQHPDLEYVEPEILLDDPLNNRKQYNAWWRFKASLMKGWYTAARKQFVDGLKKHERSLCMPPWMTLQVGKPWDSRIKVDLFDYLDLLDTFEYFSPQYYESAYGVREKTAALVELVSKKRAIPVLCMGGDYSNRWVWEEGDIRSQILEIVFAGAKGYNSWGWSYSNLRIIAEMAETNNAIAENEDVLLNGKKTDTFKIACKDRQFVSVLETGTGGLLLVSNYVENNDKKIVTVRKSRSQEYLLTDVFSKETTKLPIGQETFSVRVRPGTCSLLKWEK